MIRNLLAIIISLLLSGCAYYGTKVDDLHKEFTFPETEPKVYYNGKSIEIVVEQVAGLNMCVIDPIIIDQYLYLDSGYISSGGSYTQTFVIDFDERLLKKDWKDNLYWVTGMSGPGPFSWLNPFADHSRTIYRMKIKVNEK